MDLFMQQISSSSTSPEDQAQVSPVAILDPFRGAQAPQNFISAPLKIIQKNLNYRLLSFDAQ